MQASEYVFLGAVVLPPVALAIGFLVLISPWGLERAERSERAEHTGTVTAQAH